MIRPLRIRHRHIFMVLGLLLPMAFGLGIAAHKPVPVVVNLPAELGRAARAYATDDWEQTDIFTNAPVHLHALRTSQNPQRRAIAFSADADFLKPDLLVYWQTGNVETEESLPATALLLGAFNSPELQLPDEATRGDGVIILYSLADGEVVAVSQTVRFNNSRK